MENLKKEQTSKLRELSREELRYINGGTTYKLVYQDGKLVLLKEEK